MTCHKVTNLSNRGLISEDCSTKATLLSTIPRSLLEGEQSNTWLILLRNDRKSQHRRIKKQRRYERLAATSQLSLW